MLKVFVSAVALVAFASPASAMNWCGLLQAVPRSPADFETMAPTVEGLTGCARQPSDSAHIATWRCPDDEATPDKYEGVHITYIREPGKSIHMAVLAEGWTDLNRLRACGSKSLYNEPRFLAGNVAYRDRMQLDYRSPRLTLTSIIPTGLAAIISDIKSYGEDAGVDKMWQALYGIKTESAPYTAVKLAGLSPIDSSAKAIVSAFEARGAKVIATEELDGVLPQWTLSPPTGLAGVSQVVVKAFVQHVHNVDYVLSSTGDYETYIGLLDAQYGKSERQVDGGCTYRWWTSGRVSIRGEHCPGQPDSVRFYNEVALSQLDQYVEKLKADKAAGKDSTKPSIDSDML